MSAILAHLYSWTFLVGMIVGVGGMKLILWLQCRYQDSHDPLPNGGHRRPGRISRTWLGGLIAVACVGYVLLQAEEAHNDTVALSQKTARCQADLIEAIRARGAISDDRDDLSEEQRRLLGVVADKTAAWINQLIAPPPDIAKLDQSDPARQAWGIQVTKDFYEDVAPIRARINQITEQAHNLEESRSSHPLPSPRCE